MKTGKLSTFCKIDWEKWFDLNQNYISVKDIPWEEKVWDSWIYLIDPDVCDDMWEDAETVSEKKKALSCFNKSLNNMDYEVEFSRAYKNEDEWNTLKATFWSITVGAGVITMWAGIVGLWRWTLTLWQFLKWFTPLSLWVWAALTVAGEIWIQSYTCWDFDNEWFNNCLNFVGTVDEMTLPDFVPHRFYQETIEFSPLDKLVVTWIAIWWVESAAIWIFTVNKKVRLIRIKNTISKLRDSKIADMVEALDGTKMKSIEKEIDAIFLKEWKITRA